MDSAEAAEQSVWRLFAAIELPDAVRRRAEQVAARLASAGWRARWVKSDGIHLTVQFYGNVAVARLDLLNEALAAAATGSAPFELTADGPGVFPSPRRPRVIWLGLDGELTALGRLAEAVQRAGEPLGFTREARPFRPHITLARVRPEQQASITGLEGQFAALSTLAPIPFRVDHLALIRSQLRRDGPIYTTIRRFELRG